MILSVSRRTDIPSYFSEWFLERLKEGYVYTRNPMNPKQIWKVSISGPIILVGTVACIVMRTIVTNR